MPYATQADIEKAAGGAQALAELTDLNDSGTDEVDVDVLAAAIADADSLIDTYIGRNNSVPLAPPIPRVIQRMSADETVYVLRDQRRILSEGDKDRHELNLRWLEAAAKGSVTLGAEPAPRASELIAPNVIETPDDARIDTAAALKGLW